MKKYVQKGMKEFLSSQVLSVTDVILTAVYPFLLTYIIDNITTISGHKLAIVFGTFVVSIVLLLLEQLSLEYHKIPIKFVEKITFFLFYSVPY